MKKALILALTALSLVSCQEEVKEEPLRITVTPIPVRRTFNEMYGWVGPSSVVFHISDDEQPGYYIQLKRGDDKLQDMHVPANELDSAIERIKMEHYAKDSTVYTFPETK